MIHAAELAAEMRAHAGDRAVYLLRDPRCQSVRYVGMTRRLYARLSLHLSSARRNQGPAARVSWLRELLAENLRPVLEVVEWRPLSEGWRAYDRERYWIRHYQSLGCPLTNEYGLAIGPFLPAEVRSRIRGALYSRRVYQKEIAAVMGLRADILGTVLRGYRRPPEDFEARAFQAIETVAASRKQVPA